MKTSHLIAKLLLVLLAGAWATTGCAGDSDPGPQAWIDFPRDGATIPAGSLVTVVSHAYAEAEVAEVLLSVNGQAYRRDAPQAAGDFSEVRQEWLAEEPGRYTLQVQTFDAAGAESGQDAISVIVTGEVASEPTELPAGETATVTATAVVGDTPAATFTATPTPVASATATPTGVPPTATLTPTPLPATATATFTPLPPTPTATPTSPPPDTTPPPAPTLVVPADGLALTCRNTQTLAWLPVEDESGIAGYDIRLELQVTTNQWNLVREWGPVADKQTEAQNLLCGGIYRWTVRARDGAGNIGDWADWFHFTIAFS